MIPGLAGIRWDLVFGLILAALWAGFVFWLRRFARNRPKVMISRWAEANGFDLIALDEATSRPNPFGLRAYELRPVYEVTLRDLEIGLRRCWVLCGSFWMGALSDQIKVHWQEKSEKLYQD